MSKCIKKISDKSKKIYTKIINNFRKDASEVIKQLKIYHPEIKSMNDFISINYWTIIYDNNLYLNKQYVKDYYYTCLYNYSCNKKYEKLNIDDFLNEFKKFKHYSLPTFMFEDDIFYIYKLPLGKIELVIEKPITNKILNILNIIANNINKEETLKIMDTDINNFAIINKQYILINLLSMFYSDKESINLETNVSKKITFKELFLTKSFL